MDAALADLSLEDDEGNGEGEGWEIDQDQDLEEESFDLYLVGCFLTTTTINFQSMKIVLVNLWYALGGVTITDIGEKMFLFRFYCEANITRVVKDSPWTFNNHFLWLLKLYLIVKIHWKLHY